MNTPKVLSPIPRALATRESALSPPDNAKTEINVPRSVRIVSFTF